MTFEFAVRSAEIMMGFAFLLQSIEYWQGLSPEKYWGALRGVLSCLLILGLQPVWVESALLFTALILLHRFQGPYNGGSDAMSILVLFCLWLSHLAPSHFWQEIALGYLAFQLTFSYFQSGYIKIKNAEWRNGRALQDVFMFTAYPVSESVRRWAQFPLLLQMISWAVILFELLFPLALLHHSALVVALVIAATFHLANALFFGLNRFFWIWLSAYPVIIWFQERIVPY